MVTEEIRKAALELTPVCRKRMAEIWGKDGFLPSSHQLLFSRDPSFTFARRRRVYETTPHLRWELIASFFLHLIRGKRTIQGGRSQAISRTALLSGDASTCYFNGLILELLESFRDGPVPEWEALWEKEVIREFETDTLTYPQGNGTIPAWGYFPVKHHRFRPGNLVYKLMHQWEAIAADLDSSSMVLARLIKSGSALVSTDGTLTLLETHLRGSGEFGRNRLAYDNGVLEDDGGVLLWVQEKHNELDAGVNVNVLCLLAAMMERDGAQSTEFRDRIARLSVPILEFLGRHIALGSYAQKHFLMFYSLEAFAFLWHRLALCLDRLERLDRLVRIDRVDSVERMDRPDRSPPSLRAAFDPDDVCGALGRQLCALVEAELRPEIQPELRTEIRQEFRPGRAPFNAFDRLMVLPVLLRHGSPAAKAWLSPDSLQNLVEDVSTQAYEFGKFLYPVTFLYGNQALGLCAALNVFREIERCGQAAETAGAEAAGAKAEAAREDAAGAEVRGTAQSGPGTVQL